MTHNITDKQSINHIPWNIQSKVIKTVTTHAMRYRSTRLFDKNINGFFLSCGRFYMVSENIFTMVFLKIVVIV